MKKLICLVLVMVNAGCATHQETAPSPKAEDTTSEIASRKSKLDLVKSLKIGMHRTEVEKLLGDPGSIKETASGLSYTWVFGEETGLTSENVNNQEKHTNNFGGIAASAVGMVHPAAGLAARLGSAIYDSVESQPEPSLTYPSRKSVRPLVLTVEFRDDKVFSIQRTRPDAMSPSVK